MKKEKISGEETKKTVESKVAKGSKKNNGFKIKHSSDVKRKIALSRIKRKILKHVWIVRLAIATGILLGLFLIFMFALSLLARSSFGLYITLAKDFVFTPPQKIKIIDGRTNILILGKGGQNHEAPDLTDTIMFVSVEDDKNPSVNLVSLPRDIWMPELRAKLNSTYYWGNQKEKGGGLVLAKSSVEEVVGQPVHYGVVIDFQGFEDIVNELGGVTVDVQNSFTDNWFPIPGKEKDLCGGDPEYKCRYETVSFQKGVQWMDGATALKYVRSRHAEGDEGTDLARAARQQKLLAAIKKKVLSKEILLSPKRLLALKDITSKYIETDMDAEATAVLAREIFDARDNVKSHVLTEDFLINPPISPKYDNLYVFIPKGGNWNEVHKWVECLLTNGNCDGQKVKM